MGIDFIIMKTSNGVKDKVVQEGDPLLRQVAKSVAKGDIRSRALTALIARMKKVLASEEFGVAIAAPQVGESVRLFVVAGKVFAKEGVEETPADKVFINPVLSRLSKKKREMTEGCLSVRHKYGSVVRHEKATVKALDENGKEFTYHGSDLIAHIFQHECDHLDGILYIDKAVKLEEDEDLKGAREKFKDKHGI